MNLPLNALVSQVIAAVTSNMRLRIELNRERVYDEFLLTCWDLLRQQQKAGTIVPMGPFCMSLPRLPVEVADFSLGGVLPYQLELGKESIASYGLSVEIPRQYVRLPKVVQWAGFTGNDQPAIEYLGGANGMSKLDVFVSGQGTYNAYRRAAGQQPFALLIEEMAWLLAPQGISWTHVNFRGVLSDPRTATEFGRPYDENTDAFHAPDDFCKLAVKQLTNEYLSVGGRYSGIPNNNDGNQPIN